MPMFRKKPVTVEARQVPTVTEETEAEFAALARWCGGLQVVCAVRGYTIVVDGHMGEDVAEPGDWIVKDPHDGFKACRADIFAATYEEAEA